MTHWRRIILLGLTLFSTGIAARSYDQIIEDGTITVAVYRDFAPYSYKDANGEATGFDVELARLLAKGLGVKPDIHWMTPDETVDDDMRNHLWKGSNLTSEDGRRIKADVMMRVPYDRAYSTQRDDVGLPAHERVHMFAPYQRERWLVAYSPDRVNQVDTVARLQYHPVGVEVDSIPQFYLTTAFGGRFRNKSHSFPSIADAFNAMSRGEVDIVMGMASQLQWLHAQTPEKSRLSGIPFPMLGKPFWELGMAVDSHYRQLSYALEDALTPLIVSGELTTLAGKYGIEYLVPELYAGLITDESAQ
ncbi:substrate-binding periplasmic protein [Veronia pacifica]|uniref:Amino acid ABC transporter substrate-binding protein n=1 Tax=Veronia pacifica TaxID=1080227 RepID=A0A1C3E7Z4_9GAMM|nr:transporter substrate-binding domain-containing protein [Veronia pacifica]ODA29356.1 amino acid ABC transporter substrate-binding protein [Veronia pacifica]